jgi:hypothetical protein
MTIIANSSRSISQIAIGVFLQTVIRSTRFLVPRNALCGFGLEECGPSTTGIDPTLGAVCGAVLAIATNGLRQSISGQFEPTNGLLELQQRLSENAGLDPAHL